MGKAILGLAVFVLVVHGLIHLLGTAVYMKLADVENLKYRTTVLGGLFDLGDSGMWLFGLMWVLPAIGFIASAFGLMTGTEWWPSLLLMSTIVSLTLTTLEWQDAFMGALLNLIILVIVILPRSRPLLPLG